MSENMEHDSIFADLSAESGSAAAAFGVESVYRELLSRAPENKMEPRLDAVARAVEILGEPNKAAPVIHITGTNGKTSTARMIERILMAHDLRTGRFTSPHLSSVTERISIDGEPVSDETFVRIWEEIQPYLQMVDAELEAENNPKITYFEALTVLAFAVFADEPVDVMILEVGIGGTWDSTNVADAAVSVVTPIGLDHTDMLGETLEEIAGEKQGIIKDGGFLVSAAQDPAAAQVLLDSARAHDAQFRFEGVEFGLADRKPGVGGQMISVKGLADTYTELPLPLFGAHQAENAAVAIAAVEAFLGGGETPLNPELIRSGWEELKSPGRLEIVRNSPTVVVDAAHNPHGIRASAEAFKESFAVDEIALVIGVLQEKDARGIFETIREEYLDSVDSGLKLYLTASTSPRAIAPDELENMALDAGFDEDLLEKHEHLHDAVAAAITSVGNNDQAAGAVLITGSITVVGEARDLLGL
ncbi:bifunctional folylpolyglutamate synthase/dihydrofolate synthase [Rothia aerolata]|uniref:tetrahydrofolate synthase n=1 Tax=Rothia aerolata TaxID=1812262 RepID=A0A917INM8_9MICC|nr:folylpolyglutamate synthase/dihydrofolate synthase family protein [Rothia aerolata]GGH58145.1 dihydrofolate synthase [Rothia aerolata]